MILSPTQRLKFHASSKKNLLVRKKVDQLAKGGKLVKQYGTIADAARATGIPYSNIFRAVKDELFTAGRYIWKENRKTKRRIKT